MKLLCKAFLLTLSITVGIVGVGNAGVNAPKEFQGSWGIQCGKTTPIGIDFENDGMSGNEWSCSFTSFGTKGNGFEFSAKCSAEGDSHSRKGFLQILPTGKLYYKDDDRTEVFKKCKKSVLP